MRSCAHTDHILGQGLRAPSGGLESPRFWVLTSTECFLLATVCLATVAACPGTAAVVTVDGPSSSGSPCNAPHTCVYDSPSGHGTPSPCPLVSHPLGAWPLLVPSEHPCPAVLSAPPRPSMSR